MYLLSSKLCRFFENAVTEQGLTSLFFSPVMDFGHLTLNTPGQESLVLFYGVQFVGGRVTSLAWQLPFGVVTCTGTRDVDVTATEVAAALQGRRG